jgi:hypothetical protein
LEQDKFVPKTFGLFGGGPHICLGRNHSLMQTPIAVAQAASWKWLEPGAWGCNKKERSYVRRRGFRTVQDNATHPVESDGFGQSCKKNGGKLPLRP